MTQKDYKSIAAVFAKHYPSADAEAAAMWEELLIDLMQALAADNPRFDSIKFRNAAEEAAK